MSKKKYIVWGSAGLSKVVAEIISLEDGEILAIFDSNPNVLSSLPGVPLYCGAVGFDAWIESFDFKNQQILGVLAIGGDKGLDRRNLLDKLKKAGISCPPLIHPSSVVSNSAIVGSGSQILAGAIVNTEVKLGEVSIVNIGAKIDHECSIGSGVHIAPGATLCGCITIMDNVMVGAGAVILPRLIIGRGAIIGSGAVVTKNVPDGAVVVGNPARVRV